jgi:uncharacterized protein (DUF1330 family)
VAAYVVVEIDVTDPNVYEEYKKLAPASIKVYGGKYIIRGGRTETLEGDWSPKRFVMLEFEDAGKARAWWSSQEYRDAKLMRQRSAVTNMILVEGL